MSESKADDAAATPKEFAPVGQGYFAKITVLYGRSGSKLEPRTFTFHHPQFPFASFLVTYKPYYRKLLVGSTLFTDLPVVFEEMRLPDDEKLPEPTRPDAETAAKMLLQVKCIIRQDPVHGNQNYQVAAFANVDDKKPSLLVTKGGFEDKCDGC